MKARQLPDTMIPGQVLAVYHRNKKQFVSVLQAAVLAESQFEVVPEIIDIFGEDYAVKFLEIFSGRVIAVPAIRNLVAMLRKVSIWLALSAARQNKQDYDTAVSRVSKFFALRKTHIRSIDASMSDLMSSLSMEVRPDGHEEEDNKEESQA